MAIALVTGNITYTSGASSVTTSGAITISPDMSAGQILIVNIASISTCFITGTNLEIVSSIPFAGASNSNATLLVFRATGTASSFTITQSATSGLVAQAAVFSATYRLRLDTSNTGTSTGTAIATSAAGTTATANELWIAGCSLRNVNGGTFSANQIGVVNATATYQSASTLGTTADRAGALWYRIVSATGAPTATATGSSSGVWSAIVATLEEAAAPGGGLRLAGHGGLAA